ncbi:MAG: IS3 family transposase [Thiomicrorhabdus sp.]|nr:IS3 family transposase [Thiomicrorhabdus sp.]
MASHLEEYSLNVMLHVLELQKSSYFSWTKLNKTKQEAQQQKTNKLVEDAFYALKRNGGTRQIKHHLFNKKKIVLSRRKIGYIMKTLELIVKTQRKFKKGSTAPANSSRIQPNLLNREFEVSYPNQVWVGDITEIKTTQGKLYLACYIDLYSRKVVGWSLENNMRSELTETALKRALWSRNPPKGLMVHTDQGSQFISNDYRTLLNSWGLKQSMSRRGNCWDNAVIESFFKTLKTEVIYQLKRLIEADHMKRVVSEYIGYYNHDRPHSTNEYLSPIEFEQLRLNKIAQIENNLGTK